MSEQAPRPDADALGDIGLAAYQLPRQAEYAEDRAEAFDVTDTHEALGAQDHLLFENDSDARHRYRLVCQPLCLWTGGINMTISTFETLPTWDCANGNELQSMPKVHNQKISGITCLTAEHFATCSWDQTIKIWRRDGRLVRTLTIP